MPKLMDRLSLMTELKRTLKARIVNRKVLIKAIDFLADNIDACDKDQAKPTGKGAAEAMMNRQRLALDSIDRLTKLLPYVMYKELDPNLIALKNPGLLDAPGITFNVTNYFDKRMDKIAKLNNDTEVSVIDSKCQ